MSVEVDGTLRSIPHPIFAPMEWPVAPLSRIAALTFLFAAHQVAAQSSVASRECARVDIAGVTVTGRMVFEPGTSPPADARVQVKFFFGDGGEWLQIRTPAPDYRFDVRLPVGVSPEFSYVDPPLPWLNDRAVTLNNVRRSQSVELRADAGIVVDATFRYPQGTVAPPPFNASVVRSDGDVWFPPVEVANGQMTFAARRGTPYTVVASPRVFGDVRLTYPGQSAPHAIVVDVDRHAVPAAQAITLTETPLVQGRIRRTVALPIVLAEPSSSGGGELPYVVTVSPGLPDELVVTTATRPVAGRRQRIALIRAALGNDAVANPPRTARLRFTPTLSSVATPPPIDVTILDDDGPGLPPQLTVDGAIPTDCCGDTATLLRRAEGAPGDGWTVSLSLDRPAPAGGAEITVDTVAGLGPSTTLNPTITAAPAIDGVDYQAVVRQRVIFLPGSRTTSVRIEGIGNDRPQDERYFYLAFTDPRGLVAREPIVEMRIVNDDVDHSPAARPDLLPVTPLSRANPLDVLANDLLPPARFPAGTLEITESPQFGTASVDTRGTATPIDDRIVYTPQTGRAGQFDRLRYRVCNLLGDVCLAARVDIPIRPVPAAAPTWFPDSDAGHRDVVFSGLPALPDARFEVLARPFEVSEVPEGTVVPTLSSRFTPQWGWGLTLPFLPAGGPAEVTRTVLVHVEGERGSDVDLYVAYDANNDRERSDDEVLCASASAGSVETCIVRFTQTRTSPLVLDIAIVNTGPSPVGVRMIRGGIDGVTALPGVVATGPTRLAEGEAFPVRTSWRSDGAAQQTRAFAGVLRARNADGATLGDVPFAIGLPPVSGPRGLVSSIGTWARFARGAALNAMFIDVPPGTGQLSVSAASFYADPPSIRLSLRPVALPSEGSNSAVGTAPPEDASSIVGTSNDRSFTVVVANPAPGRWYIVPSTSTKPNQWPVSDDFLNIAATLTPALPAPTVRPGGYFNPSRSGHGLFLYPAGEDWAGLWYTYTQDGAPVWYYLQGAKPGANGIWTAPIYRSGWNGSRNHLTEVGRATITPTAADAFQFTYVLDGELGSEPFSSFGRGCPTIAGRVVDASGHWFDPLRSGTGYSVQLLPNYEFHAVFAYSARGVPRFLVAERGGVGGANDTLPLQQLRGFCPLCVRTGAPERTTVGVLRREFVDGQLSRINVDAAFTNGTPGTWSANDAVIPLGGLQGCAVN